MVSSDPIRDANDTYSLARQISVRLDRVDPHLVSLIDTNSMEAECYRRLRFAVELANQVGDSNVFAVCSPAAGDGKTVTSINLAGTMAQDPEAKVVLIELDLRKPYSSVGSYLGINQQAVRPGLVDKLRDNSILWGDVTSYIPDFNLHVITAGSRTTKPYELLKSKRLARLLAEARQRYDYVVVDTPPIVLLPDGQVIARWMDRIIVVVTADKTRRSDLAETLRFVDPKKVLGFVFNGQTPDYMQGYYNYAYPVEQPKGRLERVREFLTKL